MKVFSSMLLFL